MQLKATLVLVLIAALAVHHTHSWRWARKVWRGVKRVYRGAKRVWRRYGWVRQAVRHGLRAWDQFKQLRTMDEDAYEDFMTKVEQDIADDFDEDQTRDFLNGMDEIRRLSDAEYKKLEELGADNANDISEDAQTLEFLSRQMEE